MTAFQEEVARAKQWIQAEVGPSHQIPIEIYCPTRDLFQARLDTFRSLINHQTAWGSLIVAVCGEIGNNSFDHNLGSWKDIPGILFLHTDKWVILADRGQGIYQTIVRVKPEVRDTVSALKVAFTEVISGRSPEQRGNGLKFVRDIALRLKLQVFFQSGNASCKIQEGAIAFSDGKENLKGCLAIIDFSELAKHEN